MGERIRIFDDAGPPARFGEFEPLEATGDAVREAAAVTLEVVVGDRDVRDRAVAFDGPLHDEIALRRRALLELPGVAGPDVVLCLRQRLPDVLGATEFVRRPSIGASGGVRGIGGRVLVGVVWFGVEVDATKASVAELEVEDAAPPGTEDTPAVVHGVAGIVELGGDATVSVLDGKPDERWSGVLRDAPGAPAGRMFRLEYVAGASSSVARVSRELPPRRAIGVESEGVEESGPPDVVLDGSVADQEVMAVGVGEPQTAVGVGRREEAGDVEFALLRPEQGGRPMVVGHRQRDDAFAVVVAGEGPLVDSPDLELFGAARIGRLRSTTDGIADASRLLVGRFAALRVERGSRGRRRLLGVGPCLVVTGVSRRREGEMSRRDDDDEEGMDDALDPICRRALHCQSLIGSVPDALRRPPSAETEFMFKSISTAHCRRSPVGVVLGMAALLWTVGCVPEQSGGPEANPGADATPADAGGADGESVDGGTADAVPSGTREILFVGMDDTRSTYEFEVSGDLAARGLEENDEVEGLSASGVVAEPGERDRFIFIGRLENLDYTGSVQVVVDGEYRANGPKRRTGEAPDGAPTVGMTIHSTHQLLAKNGRISEKMVAKYAARAFEEAGYGWEIVYNLRPQDPPGEKSVCEEGGPSDWWGETVENGDVDVIEEDVNILMFDTRGGGCGAVGGKWGTTPARNIDEMRDWRAVGSDDWHRNMHGNLHEIGHELGARHDHDAEQEGMQHPGMGWNEPHESKDVVWWHRTPTVAGNGAPNVCGESIELRQNDQSKWVKRHQTYAECTSDTFEIVSESSNGDSE